MRIAGVRNRWNIVTVHSLTSISSSQNLRCSIDLQNLLAALEVSRLPFDDGSQNSQFVSDDLILLAKFGTT
jgi:hypothetical protein